MTEIDFAAAKDAALRILAEHEVLVKLDSEPELLDFKGETGRRRKIAIADACYARAAQAYARRVAEALVALIPEDAPLKECQAASDGDCIHRRCPAAPDTRCPLPWRYLNDE